MRKGAFSAWQLATLQRQIDELLGWLVQIPREAPATWSPRCDILDHGDHLRVRLDIPGVRAGDLELTLTEGTLRVTGKKSPPRECCPRRYLRTERSFGSFSIDIPLPAPADDSRSRATLRDGVLEVVLPRPTVNGAASHRIPIADEEP